MLRCMSCLTAAVVLALLWPQTLLSQAAADTATSAGPAPGASSDAGVRVTFWRPGDPGERLFLRARVIASNGRPLPGAVVQLRQADGTGSYRPDRYRGRLETGADGSFSLATVVPGQYWGERHIHVAVSRDGYQPLVTRILFKGDPNLVGGGGDDHVILLEESHREGERVLIGGVEFVLHATGRN